MLFIKNKSNLKSRKKNRIKNIGSSTVKKSLSILLDGLNKGDFTILLFVDIIIDGGY